MSPAEKALAELVRLKRSIWVELGAWDLAWQNADAAVAALPVSGQGDGVMVPVKPTDEMLDAGGAATRRVYSGAWNLEPDTVGMVMCEYVYRAMLAAAPTASPPRADTQEQPTGEQERE